MRPINLIYFLLSFLPIAAQKTTSKQDLFICYGKVSPSEIVGYNMVIVESQQYSKEDIIKFKHNNKKVIAYISLTEVNESAFYYNSIKDYAVDKNKNWGSFFLDINNPKVHPIILEAIGKILEKGVDGIFMDNLDNTSQWGRLAGQEEALVTLIKKIRDKHKDITLIQNSGLFLAKKLQKYTNAILIESVLTSYNFEKKEYGYQNDKQKKELLTSINRLKRELRKDVFLVEYTNEQEMRNNVVKEAASLKLPLFVANIDLQSIPRFNK